MISYAQNFEDVMIARLFAKEHKGFYIDIGAADPTHLSVTKHFYDTGWRGINVEPLHKFYDRLCSERPQDINLNAAVGPHRVGAKLYEVLELNENSTTDELVMRELTNKGNTIAIHDVLVLPLAEICERYCAHRSIDFLKVDVEGAELDVLRSGDWDRFRPIVLIIEAVSVNGTAEVWHEWEPVLTNVGYQKVWFDGLNNFYLREESLDLRVHFRLPPNVFDRITMPATVMLQKACDERLEVIQRAHIELGHWRREAAMFKEACEERLAVIERMQNEIERLQREQHDSLSISRERVSESEAGDHHSSSGALTPWKVNRPQFDSDHLAVWGKNLSFLSDPRFLEAYRRGEQSGHGFEQAYGLEKLGIEWRVHVCCWAAMHGRNLPGDFVECGVNTGILSLSVCEYIEFNATGRTFWLFDTFAGIPESAMSEAEKPIKSAENARLYRDVWELAKSNFAPYPNAQLVRGLVPDTLYAAPIDQVCYLSLDMNIAAPELAAMEHFWPKLSRGAVVILDDYAWQGYEEQKLAMDKFAKSVHTEVLTLPTGQGVLVKY